MSRLEKLRSCTSGFSSVKKQIYQSQAWGFKKNSAGVEVGKMEMSYCGQEMKRVVWCRAKSRAKEADCSINVFWDPSGRKMVERR